MNQKTELFDEKVQSKPWASSEITFADNILAKIDQIRVKPKKTAMDLSLFEIS